MPRDAVSRTANVGTVGKNGLNNIIFPQTGNTTMVTKDDILSMPSVPSGLVASLGPTDNRRFLFGEKEVFVW